MVDLTVQCRHLTKKFHWYQRHDSLKTTFANLLLKKEVWEWYVLKNINLQIFKGERVGIIGRNGCGKSTLLKLFTGIYKPTSGFIKIYSRRMLALIELGVGFYHDLTGRENIRLNWVFNGLPNNELKHRFDEIVEFAGIEKFLDTPLKYYSSGMVTRLGFAIASHADPDLLIVDEVLAVGDLQFQMRCYEKIDQLCQNGATLILVSHNPNDIERVCERAIWLDGGTICNDGPTSQILSSYDKALLV
jgi:ABC-type polysaccharide/polyol phosphate transport system ATPase subunit